MGISLRHELPSDPICPKTKELLVLWGAGRKFTTQSTHSVLMPSACTVNTYSLGLRGFFSLCTPFEEPATGPLGVHHSSAIGLASAHSVLSSTNGSLDPYNSNRSQTEQWKIYGRPPSTPRLGFFRRRSKLLGRWPTTGKRVVPSRPDPPMGKESENIQPGFSCEYKTRRRQKVHHLPS